MAGSAEKRKGFWDDDEEEERKPGITGPAKAPPAIGTESLQAKIHDANVLLEQTHQLYQQYLNGVERRVPVEKAQLLESKVAEITRMGSLSTSNKFKINQFLQHYQTFKDLWARKLRDKERK